MKRIVLGCAAVGLLVAGCGEEGTRGSSAPSSTPDAPGPSPTDVATSPEP